MADVVTTVAIVAVIVFWCGVEIAVYLSERKNEKRN